MSTTGRTDSGTEGVRDPASVPGSSASDSLPAPAFPSPPTEEEAQRALRYHIEGRAAAIREKYGRHITGDVMLQILEDTDAIRYPVVLRFSADVLAPGEFALPQAIGNDAGEGFTLFLHPWFRDNPENWPALIAYHIPSINYGDIISSDEAELYGATLLGLEIDEYYELVCRLADTIPENWIASSSRLNG